MGTQVDKGIADLVGCLTDPIIVFPGGWGESLPEWLKTAITLERLVMDMKALKGEPPTGTDAEACAYLMTVSLTQPIGSDWTQIYLYVAGQACQKNGKGEMPADIKVDSLNEEQARNLKGLKDWLYRKRIEARKDRTRAERKAESEEREATVKPVECEQLKFF